MLQINSELLLIAFYIKKKYNVCNGYCMQETNRVRRIYNEYETSNSAFQQTYTLK